MTPLCVKEITSTRTRLKSMSVYISFHFVSIILCVSPQPYTKYFICPQHDIAFYAENAVKHQPTNC